ncbi:hypothetical protein [Desulfonema magnum]|uniref:Uncharacterized protein n=1 Tax=Desulfonema magnum TaxID=45655 RepID=A0A975GLU1_9BACT|nr:hypothetical protein [Desulfonema magnum]QTA86201.1 Uncharacterized protein dnm_022220 [Desulfonema magnum]
MNFDTETNIKPFRESEIVAIVSCKTLMNQFDTELKEELIYDFSSHTDNPQIYQSLRDIKELNSPAKLMMNLVQFPEYQDTGSHSSLPVQDCQELYFREFYFSEIANFSAITSNEKLIDENLILEQAKNLTEANRISEARKLLSKIQPGISRKLDNWRRVLAEPKVKIEKSATGGSVKEDALWLKNNSSKYKGKWVALKQGSLLGSHESRVKLHFSLKESGKLIGTTFFRVEN